MTHGPHLAAPPRPHLPAILPRSDSRAPRRDLAVTSPRSHRGRAPPPRSTQLDASWARLLERVGTRCVGANEDPGTACPGTNPKYKAQARAPPRQPPPAPTSPPSIPHAAQHLTSTSRARAQACEARSGDPSVISATHAAPTRRSDALLHEAAYAPIREACGPLADELFPPSECAATGASRTTPTSPRSRAGLAHDLDLALISPSNSCRCYFTKETVALVAKMFARDIDLLGYSVDQMCEQHFSATPTALALSSTRCPYPHRPGTPRWMRT